MVRRVLAGVAVMAMAIGLWTAQASAHVTINTLGVVTQGSFAKVGFSVPNERADAGTVKLKVQFPQDHPLAYVSVQPMTGWDIETTMRKLDTPIQAEGATIDEVVDTITWTAQGDTQIKPGEFELFWVSAGQMPTDATSLTFPAIQTYSSGEEVAWIDQSTEGGAEPEHPAPTLQLAAGSGDDAHGSGSSDSSSSSDDSSSDTLAIVALVVGALGLVVGGVALATSRRKPAPPATPAP